MFKPKNARDPRASPGLPARPLLALGLVCLLAAISAPCTAAASAALSPSEYGVSSLCSAPTPGFASCLGLRLVAREPLAHPGARSLPGSQAQSEGSDSGEAEADQTPGGEALVPAGSATQAVEHTKPEKKALTPANLLTAYSLTGATPPSTQTIAIVDAFDDATIAADLQVFSNQFSLPACTEANGCFRKVNQTGKTSPLPASSGELERGWALEIATDVEIAHGLCPSCDIVLVEAESNANANLYAAEQTAASLGATEISNSWGGGEPSGDSAAFNHPGIVITASSGDYGYLNWFSATAPESADYPASSPHVVAVGGTRLNLNATTKAWESETVWNDGGVTNGTLKGAGAGGGGCSGLFGAPTWQQNLPNWSAVGCGTQRAVADVSADADPYTGVAVYDSTETEGSKGWATIGGTSVAAPIIASAFALAGGAHGVSYPAQLLYENAQLAPGSLHDVTAGSNGECLKPFEKGSGTSGCSTGEEAQTCAEDAICLAGGGYDGPTGVGTPNGITAFQLPSAAGIVGKAAEPPSAGSQGDTHAPSGTSAPGTSSSANVVAPSTPIVVALSLTRSAIVALNRKRPKVSKISFAFTLTTAARVRVTVTRRLRVHGRMQWKSISAPVTISVPAGAQSRRLSGRGALASGQYQLTLVPEHGRPRSVTFHIG